MAQSDTYFPTKSEAMAELRSWGVKPGALKPDDIMRDCLVAETEDGSFVYLERIHVVPTRAGIALALQHIPHR